MAISLDEVNRLAKLARLRFTEPEKQKLQDELGRILDYVDQLKQIKDVPVAHDPDPDAINLMRDDVADQTVPPEEFLRQAPVRDGDFVKVKSILE